MSTHAVERLHLAILDGHLMDDATLARMVPECRSLTAFTTDTDQPGLAQRWAAIAPGTDIVDGGHVADLREAMVECAKRRIVVICTGVPEYPAKFVALALQGAASMTEFEVAGVAVHVMRPVERPGTVAWLTDTGELSGYGVLFAVGYAHLHSTGLDLIEPTGGLDRPRTAEALDDALAFAEAAGVPITRHTDPSPIARVLRDEHCMVVHPVLDAPKGFNLLHPGELSRKAVASGNPAVVVDLLEQFPGDVVAVFDGVHLLHGSIPAARIAAGVALGVVAAAAVGTMVASPASAAPSHSSSSAHELGNNVDVSGHVTGITFVATPHSHGQTTLTLHNNTDHDITLTVTGGHGHEGGGAGPRVVTVSAHGYESETLGGGVKQWFIQPGQQQKEPVAATGIPGALIEEKSQVVTPEIVPNPLVDIEGQGRQPVLVPPLAEQGPMVTAVVENPSAVVEAPIAVPPLTEQGPMVTAVVENPTAVVEAPVLIPPLPEQGTPVSVPNPQVPGPEEKVDAPTLVPPPRETINEITQSSVSASVTSVVTPESVVGVDGVVTPGTTSAVTTPAIAGTDTETGTTVLPGTTTTPTTDAGVTSTGGHGPTTPATHHRSTPTVVTDGTGSLDHHAPQGELAHTGGNTAILAIVAGSLIAAGAGLAVAGRLGKDEADHATPVE